MSVEAMVLKYYAARLRHDDHDEQKKKSYKAMKAAEYHLVEEMMAKGVKSQKFADGTTVSIKTDTQISVTQGNMDEIRAWLRETIGDDSDFVREQVVKKPVLDYVKAELAAGVPPDEIPEFLKLDTRPQIAVRGWKARQ